MMTGSVTSRTIMRWWPFPILIWSSSGLPCDLRGSFADASCRTIVGGCSLVCFFAKTLELMEEGLIIRFWPIFLKFKSWQDLGISLNFNECVFVIGLVSFWLFFQIWSLSLSRALSWGWDVAISIPISLSAQSISSHWWKPLEHFTKPEIK